MSNFSKRESEDDDQPAEADDANGMDSRNSNPPRPAASVPIESFFTEYHDPPIDNGKLGSFVIFNSE